MGQTIEEKKVDRLYELLEFVKDSASNEMIASLIWAIFELENQYCKEE